MLLLSTPGGVTQQVVERLGDLSGKTLIDAVNPLLPDLKIGPRNEHFGMRTNCAMGERRARGEVIQHPEMHASGKEIGKG